jgi:glycosyltransferase involved in cell wall biosynthesis
MGAGRKQLRVSVVVPLFNEAHCLSEFFDRTCRALKTCKDYEIIFVDDGSTDQSWAILEAIHRNSKKGKVKLVRLTRNFGHQLAVVAGLKLARFEIVSIIDADLQDPPELITEMANLISSKVDIVYGQRIKRKGETFLKRFTANLFYKVFNSFSDFRIPLNTGDFRVVSKRVIEQVLQSSEPKQFLRGAFAYTGYNSYAFEYVRHRRFGGKTKYSYRKMFALASNAMFLFSDFPFRLFVKLSIWLMFFALTFSIWIIISALFEGFPQGWLSVFTLVLFLGSINFCFLAFLGKYILQILEISKARPAVYIDRIIK